MPDAQYTRIPYLASEIEHRYGTNIHILADPLSLTLLARLGHPDTVQPEVGWLVRQSYEYLLHHVICAEFPRRTLAVDTRMKSLDPGGVFAGELVDTSARVTVTALARAGLLPSQVCFEELCRFMDTGVVRQDHIAAQRATDKSGEVTGTVIASAKISGPVDGHLLLVPDPMGATGGTVLSTLDYYAGHGLGSPAKAIFMHLMVTPEYLRKVHTKHPGAIVYALRLDRGRSAPDVLATTPGERWDEEIGLTEKGYLVPGAGGVGELLNNSDV